MLLAVPWVACLAAWANPWIIHPTNIFPAHIDYKSLHNEDGVVLGDPGSYWLIIIGLHTKTHNSQVPVLALLQDLGKSFPLSRP